MKKWTFLVASAMLVGATPVFTGCIDNDEPEGISVLRGAKAELLKAKASVEAAKVAQVQADAALTLAQAEVQKAEAARIQAIADYESAKALEMQFKAELQNIKNEEQRADLENKIKIYEEQRAAAEREAQKAAAELETSLMYWKGELAKQQAAYEIALKDLALAKTTLTQKQQDYLEPWSDALDAAKTNVDNAAKKLERKANFLAYAVRELDKAEAQKSATIQAEYQVRETKISWDAAIKAEEVAKEATTKDIAATNWDEERIKLDAQREEVRNNLLQANIKKTDIENQEATKELGAKTNELKVAYEDMAGTYYENGTVKTESKTNFEFDPIKIESNDPALPDPVSFETNEDQQLYKYSDYVKSTLPNYYYTLPMINWINSHISTVKSWSTTTDGKAYTAELIRDLQQQLGNTTQTVDTWKTGWSNLVAIYLNSDASDYISGMDGYDAVKEKVEEYNNAAKLYNEAAAAYYDFANKRDISDQEYQDALQKNSDDKQAALADNAAKYQGKIDVIEDNLKKAETAYNTKVAVKDKCYAEYLQAPSDEKKAALDAAVAAAQEAETAYILAQTNKQDLINEADTWKAKQDEVTNATFAVELAKLNEAYYEAHPNNAEQTQLNALAKVKNNANSTYWDVRSEVTTAYRTFMYALGLSGYYNRVNYLEETKEIGSYTYTEYQQLEPAKALNIDRTSVKNGISNHSRILFGNSSLIRYMDSNGNYTTTQLKELTPAKIKELVTDNHMSSYPDAKFVPYSYYLNWYQYSFGYVGKVMAYELQIEQAQAYLDNDGKAVKDLLDQLAAAKAKVEEQIEANTATVEAAKEAYNKSQEAYDGLFTEILSEIDNAEAEVTALTAVITEIEGKISEYLNTENVTTIDGKKPVTVEQFRAALELIYTNARKTTKDAEIAYQEAVEDLANINSDEKDVVAFAQKMWDDAKAKLETAQAELEAANDALQAEIERISTVE